jgi:transcription elongation factor Elf1
MSEFRLPLCPICKHENLLPLSTWVLKISLKNVIGTWICTNCGFYVTAGKNSVTDPEDIIADFNMPLRARIEYLRKEYQK